LGLARVVMLVVVAHQNICALAGIGECHCPTDTTVRTGNHGLFVGQPACPSIAALAIIRGRVHCGALSGHRLPLLREWRPGKLRIHIALLLLQRGSAWDQPNRSVLSAWPCKDFCARVTG